MTPKCYSYIRFSTPEQQKGDSLRRQLRMSEDYAKEHGLELDDMRDLGLSAFKGQHRTRGALGRFLSLVKEGKIPKGSTLIVESLDRLSREQVFDALDQFRDIIRAGIRIVTLTDRMEYTRESINANIGQLMFSLTIMSRAYEESAIKAKRLKAAWSGKRDKIDQQKLTARAPAWLKLNGQRTAFELIPERAAIVERIFRDKLSGKGVNTITRELNQQTVWLPHTQKRNNGPPEWRESYIQKILRNRAVIGEYQPHLLVSDSENGKTRQPIGEAIRNYYPSIVPEELFYAVQKQLDENRERAGKGGGQNGKISNLFGHIAKCGYCGGSMAFVDKGPKPKGGSYLVCDAARRNLPGCKRRPVRYDEFEELILTYCRGLNAADLLPGGEERESALHLLRQQLCSYQQKAKDAAERVENLADTIATTKNASVRETLEKKLATALEDQSFNEAEAERLSKEMKQLSRVHDETGVKLESLRELLVFMKEQTGEDLINVRRQLRAELRELIERIDVYPVGRVAMTTKLVKHFLNSLLDVHPDTSPEELERWEAKLTAQIENKDLRKYIVTFKSGSMQSIEPAKDEKLVLELDRVNRKLYGLEIGPDGKTRFIDI